MEGFILSKAQIIEGVTPPAPKIKIFFPFALYLICSNEYLNPRISVFLPTILFTPVILFSSM